MASSEEPGSSSQLQIKFLAADEALAVPSTTLSVPSSTSSDGLNKILQKLLEESCDDLDEEELAKKTFEFVVLDSFLRGSLAEFLEGRTEVSAESVLEITYLERNPPPNPEKNVNHDDWVAGVSVCKNYVLTACYDNTISIFERGEKKLTIPGHSGPARDVVWISLDEEAGVGTFASCAHDQIVNLYQWNISTNAIDCVNACKGHERSADCLAVDASKTYLASGSFDTNLKVWSTKLQTSKSKDEEDEEEVEETEKKKSKISGKRALTRTPMMTLAGHKEGISGVAWTEENEILTSSWDHTIKVWDFEMGGMKSELVGNKSFFGLSYSTLNRTIITASADRAIRVYDPRSKDGVIVKAQFTSHNGWVTCVDWCNERENLFISGGHDQLVKLWDRRSFASPLYDLKGHDDRILCCDWSERDFVVSGGCDNSVKLFKSNVS